MRWLLVASLVVGCAGSETVRVKRWPTHRQDRDARIEKLENELKVVIEHVTKLEAELAAVRQRPSPVTAVPPAPTAAPASTPATP
jgi:hypothetical protein